jgi:hypothetical protein
VQVRIMRRRKRRRIYWIVDHGFVVGGDQTK